MLRKIMCNYEFMYKGNTFKSLGIYLGGTNNPKNVKNKDYTCDVICLALKLTKEDLARIADTKYWDITLAKLETAGFHFKQIELYFYPEE